MSKDILIINGQKFEVIYPKSVDKESRRFPIGRKTLFDCYEKPSITKQDIYYEWMQWARETDGVIYMTISSYNIYQFTLTAEYSTPNFYGYLVITRAHNYFYCWADKERGISFKK